MDIDTSAVQLRWATADDSTQVEKLLEPSILEGMRKLYSKSAILKLIETASISIAIVGPDNTIDGLAVFDDYPHVSKFTRTPISPILTTKTIGSSQ
jgi:hypothetical protein